eukprot:gene15252-biopygen224
MLGPGLPPGRGWGRSRRRVIVRWQEFQRSGRPPGDPGIRRGPSPGPPRDPLARPRAAASITERRQAIRLSAKPSHCNVPQGHRRGTTKESARRSGMLSVLGTPGFGQPGMPGTARHALFFPESFGHECPACRHAGLGTPGTPGKLGKLGKLGQLDLRALRRPDKRGPARRHAGLGTPPRRGG